jgi:hypothetical protein
MQNALGLVLFFRLRAVLVNVYSSLYFSVLPVRYELNLYMLCRRN